MSRHKRRQPKMPQGACFPQARLAEAWVLYQCPGEIFEPETGLFHGTIYPELVRPYQPHPNTPDEVIHRRLFTGGCYE